MRIECKIYIINVFQKGLFGLNFKINHNHTLDTAAILRFLPSDQTIRLKFEELFWDGMSITEAFKHHKKILELDDNFLWKT